MISLGLHNRGRTIFPSVSSALYGKSRFDLDGRLRAKQDPDLIYGASYGYN